MAVRGNEIETNSGNGLIVQLDGSTINTLSIDQNNAGTAAPAGTYSFTGNTNNLGWFFQNTSSNLNIDITRIEVDITGNPDGLTWATTRGFFARPFSHFAPFSTAVGFESVNGIQIDPTISTTTDINGNTLLDGGVPDGSTTLDLGFNDFDTNAVFGGDFGFSATLVAGDSANDSIYFGDSLRGSPVRVTFTGGRQLVGRLSNGLSASFSASQVFPITSGGISNNQGDGVVVRATNNSVINSMSMTDNIVDSNTGDGVILDIQNSVVSPGQNIQVADNAITNNTGTGFSLVLPDTNGNSFGVDFANNTISGNTGGAGVDIQLDDNAGANFSSSFIGNTISNNANEGINLDISQNVALDVTDVSSNTVSGNGGVGLRLNATNNTSASLVFGATGHNTFDRNTDAGLGVTMNGNSQGQLTVLDSDSTTRSMVQMRTSMEKALPSESPTTQLCQTW